MHPYVAEFLGTALLILFGNGVVCNVVLCQTKGHGADWLTIAAGWGIAVYIGVFCASGSSEAHLNPAVSIAMVVAGKQGVMDAIGYIAAQMLGAMGGATVVYLYYREHFKMTDSADDRLACFATAPAIRNFPQAFFCEAVGTFTLILPIFLMVSPSISIGEEGARQTTSFGLGALGALPVGLLVFGIGASLGGTTGYAINPARDLGPRLVHWMLPTTGSRNSDWEYAWVPVLGPITGSVIAAIVYKTLLTG
jgi:glycerol uptake facilitator protein